MVHSDTQLPFVFSHTSLYPYPFHLATRLGSACTTPKARWPSSILREIVGDFVPRDHLARVHVTKDGQRRVTIEGSSWDRKRGIASLAMHQEVGPATRTKLSICVRGGFIGRAQVATRMPDDLIRTTNDMCGECCPVSFPAHRAITMDSVQVPTPNCISDCSTQTSAFERHLDPSYFVIIRYRLNSLETLFFILRNEALSQNGLTHSVTCHCPSETFQI